MSPKIVDKEKKKLEILHAAMKVFAERGLKNSRMVDIAAKAGIGKGTIYEYFRNRDEMLTQAFYLFFGEIEKPMADEIKAVKSPPEKIAMSIRVIFDSLAHFPIDMLVLFVDFWAEGIHRQNDNGVALLDLAPMYDQFRRHFVQILNEGIDAALFRPMDTNSAASIIMAIIDGLLLQIIVDHEAFDYNSTIDETINIVLNGINKTKTE